MKRSQEIRLTRAVMVSLGVFSGLCNGVSLNYSFEAAALSGEEIGEGRILKCALCALIWAAAAGGYFGFLHRNSMEKHPWPLAPIGSIPILLWGYCGMTYPRPTVQTQALLYIVGGLCFGLIVTIIYLIQRWHRQ